LVEALKCLRQFRGHDLTVQPFNDGKNETIAGRQMVWFNSQPRQLAGGGIDPPFVSPGR